jgi:hypothetical protein
MMSIYFFFIHSHTIDIDTCIYIHIHVAEKNNNIENAMSFQNKQRYKEHKNKLAPFILNLRLYSLCVQRKRRTNEQYARAHRIERERERKKER